MAQQNRQQNVPDLNLREPAGHETDDDGKTTETLGTHQVFAFGATTKVEGHREGGLAVYSLPSATTFKVAFHTNILD